MKLPDLGSIATKDSIRWAEEPLRSRVCRRGLKPRQANQKRVHNLMQMIFSGGQKSRYDYDWSPPMELGGVFER